MPVSRETLIDKARAAALHAYQPYSHFRVGAAVVVKLPDGREEIVTGANVENASYGLAICAERNALFAAVHRFGVSTDKDHPILPTITQIAVSCYDASTADPLSSRSPCGACRQVMAELLSPDAEIYIDGEEKAFTLQDLLPAAFSLT